MMMLAEGVALLRLAVDVSRLIVGIVDPIYKDGSFLRTRRTDVVVAQTKAIIVGRKIGGHREATPHLLPRLFLPVTKKRTYMIVLAG